MSTRSTFVYYKNIHIYWDVVDGDCYLETDDGSRGQTINLTKLCGEDIKFILEKLREVPHDYWEKNE